MILRRCIRTAAAAAKTDNKKWQILVAVCIERPAVVSAQRSNVQEEYYKFMAQVEKENSLLSNHELMKIEDKIIAEKIAKADYDAEESIERRSFTAQDIEDSAAAAIKAFETESIETEADKKKDFKSSYRCLRERLYFIADEIFDKSQKNSVQPNFIFPSTPVKEEETLREACDRLLSEITPNGKFQTIGNAPIGFAKYDYAKPIQKRTNFDGAKLFYFKTHLLEPFTPNSELIADYQWVTKEEMKVKTRPVVHKIPLQFLF